MSDRAFISTRKGLFVAERSGNGKGSWKLRPLGFRAQNVTLMLPDAHDGTLYAALNHGHFGCKLHRSSDAGLTWEACAAPAYPKRAEGAPPELDTNGRPIPDTLQLIWSLESGANPGELWCGTIPGGLFHSADRGDSWQLVGPLWDHPDRRKWLGGGADYPGIHSICLDPRDKNTIAVGVSCGGVWMSRDAGKSWQCKANGMRAEYMPPDRAYDPLIQDPHRVVQCANKPDFYWAQHHNGIFRTTDGSNSWSEITNAKPSGFGFAVAVHPKDPETAWFVPAAKDEVRIPVEDRLVVTRTRDGCKTFELLSDGLPSEPAYDIVFRHALDVDGNGERLIFGSTTGSAWVSENGGDSWAALSHHLPPIYAVRFA